MSWVNVIAYEDGEIVGVHVMPAGPAVMTEPQPLPGHVATFACPCRPTIIRDELFHPPIFSHHDAFTEGSSDRPV
jgi:hypothetical protein